MFDRLTAVHVFSAPAHVVYACWLSPTSIVEPVVRIEVEARVGGALVLHARGAGGEATMTGYFVEVREGVRLVYSWHWDGDAEPTLVTVNFRAAGERTVVEVTHEGFVDERSRDIHRAGWSSYFAGLAAFLA